MPLLFAIKPVFFKLMTVKQIAALANVSIGTVDRVIYHRGRVAADTKARIEAIIEK
jgi:LacI family transcriptional regulator